MVDMLSLPAGRKPLSTAAGLLDLLEVGFDPCRLSAHPPQCGKGFLDSFSTHGPIPTTYFAP